MTDTPFSNFFRNATEEEKRKVYEQVAKQATQKQNEYLNHDYPVPDDKGRQRMANQNGEQTTKPMYP